MSGSRIALDTNIILYLLSGDKTLSVFLQDKEGFVSIVTELELIGYPDITSKELQKIRDFLKDCVVIDINDEIKTIYTRLRKEYKLKLGDAMAAATAIYMDIPFISADKSFSKVSELQLTLYTP